MSERETELYFSNVNWRHWGWNECRPGGRGEEKGAGTDRGSDSVCLATTRSRTDVSNGWVCDLSKGVFFGPGEIGLDDKVFVRLEEMFSSREKFGGKEEDQGAEEETNVVDAKTVTVLYTRHGRDEVGVSVNVNLRWSESRSNAATGPVQYSPVEYS